MVAMVDFPEVVAVADLVALMEQIRGLVAMALLDISL
jgi:hypothetical protein